MNETQNNNHGVCPMEKVGSLEKGWRKWLHNPKKILKPYIHEGMAVLDIGCGPGFFTLPLAEMVGKSGKVIATDMQQGMLDKVMEKIKGTDLEQRIELRLTPQDSLGVTAPVDFVLAFYILHELPDMEKFLHEVKSVLKPDGRMLVTDPTFHVSKKEFTRTLELIKQAGFTITSHPRIWFSRTALVQC